MRTSLVARRATRLTGTRATRLLGTTASALAALALTAMSPSGQTQSTYKPVTDHRLLAASSDPGWLMYRHDYGSTGYSRLHQIDSSNVADLRQVWDYKSDYQQGHEAAPIVNGSYMFVTTPKDELLALDATSGKQLWKYTQDLSNVGLRTVCCDVVNRGVALYGDRVYMTTLDNHVVALDARTGKVDWAQQLEPAYTGYAMTLAPLVVKGKIIVGISGGEYGARGFVTALDAANGKTLWKTYTIPSPSEPGGKSWPEGAYKNGGGATWLTGSYDPATDSLFWGVGNPGPWLAVLRPGKNLYTDSVIALNPANGKLKWYYQYTPHDTWDYDGTNEPIMTSLSYGGKTYKAIVSASRNGYFYAINRVNGKLIYAEPFVHALSVTGIKDGVSQTDDARRPDVGKQIFTCPSFLGGKNWWPMSVDPQTHYAYVPTLHACMTMKGATVSYRAGLPFLGESFKIIHDPTSPSDWGSVQAIDLNTGKQAWTFDSALPWNSGMVSTAGGLVFSGSADGHLYGFDAKSGKVLWTSPKMTSGVIGVPVTYEVGGKQYVAVWSGWGGATPIWGGDMAKDVANIPTGGHLYVFGL